MQLSELQGTALVFSFLIIIVTIVGMFLGRARKLEHEERRLMIEKGITPPPRFTGGWPQVKQQEVQARFEERRLMIEKGMLPPEAAAAGRWEREDFLQRGIGTLFLGIGLGISYYLLPDSGAAHWYLGLLSPTLTLVGLGWLTYYAVSATKSAEGGHR